MFRSIASWLKGYQTGTSSTAANRDSTPTGRGALVESLESRTLFSSGPTMYAADSHGALYTLNLGTGKTHTIGSMHVTMFDIAFSKTGQLYGVDASSSLYKINKTTAKVTKIGSVGFFVNALTFGSNGTLYGAGFNNFVKINISTGHGTKIGSLGSNTSAGDLAFDNKGNLFLSTNADKLVKVNVSNGKTTTIGSIGFHQVFGLGFSGGVMYGLSNASEKAFKINLSTGKGTSISFFGANVVGANGASFT